MTSPDDTKPPPVAPYKWAEGVHVRKRGTQAPAWRVESQVGPLVRITRETPRGFITMTVDWSEIVQVHTTPTTPTTP